MLDFSHRRHSGKKDRKIANSVGFKLNFEQIPPPAENYFTLDFKQDKHCKKKKKKL